MAGFLLAGCDVSVDIDVDDGVRGSGTVIGESREVSGFNEVVLLGSGDVSVSVTGTESLTIEAEDNIMPLLTAEVRSGRLELGSDSSFSATKGITYTISAAAFDGVTINGSGNVEVSGIDANSFEAIINGSGDVEPAGTTVELTVSINGSGNFHGENLVAPRGSVEVAGSGSVVVNVTDDLMVLIAGSGDVEYLGNPTLIQEIAGSGDISQR
ncbi:MAG: DUF2807 domain-containing protein [Acidimicrobiia bacterium]|nr:DUF2807 domain-containing protein [Acidimicrobiia bacterium]